MNINEDLNNKILIIPNNIKTKTIKYINNLPKLTNVKILSLDEFIKSLTIEYDEKAIIYLMENKNLSYQNSKEILNNLKYSINTDNSKINYLYNLKTELINNNIIRINKLFKNSIQNKEIIFYGFDYIDKLLTDWHDRGFTTTEQVQQFLSDMKQKSKGIKDLEKSTKNYQNYNQRNYDNLNNLYANKL